MMSNPELNPVGVFDSGVGGLSVLTEIRSLMPKENLLYVADSGFAPYGDKSTDYIIDRAEHIVRFFLSHDVKSIVVACNTATSAAVDRLRTWCPVPIVAMEPAIKPAALHTTSGVVAILATVQTLSSVNVNRLISEHGKDIKILLHPCPGFVELVERGDLDSDEAIKLVARHIQPLQDHKVDTIVLGCTHYPFLKQLIATSAGSDMSIIDPSAAIAKQLERRLFQNELLSNSAELGSVKFFTSGNINTSKKIIKQLWVEEVNISQLSKTDKKR